MNLNELFIDVWYRKKYNVPYGSIEHRSISPLDMFYQWQEDKEFNKIDEVSKNEMSDEEFDEIDLENTEDWLK